MERMTVTSGAGVDTGTMARLKRSADELAAITEAGRAEAERRDSLICQARDQGESWRAIAKAARLSMARCAAIVAGALGVQIRPVVLRPRGGRRAGRDAAGRDELGRACPRRRPAKRHRRRAAAGELVERHQVRGVRGLGRLARPVELAAEDTGAAELDRHRSGSDRGGGRERERAAAAGGGDLGQLLAPW